MKEIKITKNEYSTLPEEEEIRLRHSTHIAYKLTIPVIDSILDNKGYNKTTYKIIFLTFIILTLEGLHMSLFSSMIIPLQNYFKINSNETKFVSSILFVGVGLGSFVSGYTTLKYGRPFMINLFLFVLFVSNLIMAVSLHFIIFVVCRFIIGISLGIIVPMTINLLTEYLPLKLRSFVLTGVWSGFSIGTMFLLLVMIIFMPNLEISQLGTTLTVLSFLPLTALILNLIFLQDSPRNLILRYKDDEAIKILENISSTTINDEVRSRITYEAREGTNSEISNKFSEIFNRKYFLLSILLSYIWFLNSVISYGPNLIYTLTLKALGQDANFTNNGIICNQILVNLIWLPSNLFGGILSEISFLGRNKSTLMNFIMAIIFMFLLIINTKYIPICFGLSQAFVGIAFNINTAYSCEVFPTKIRDRAIGFLFFCTRLGGFASQIIYIYFQEKGIMFPYYFTIVFMITNICFINMLPFETYGQPLDIEYENKEKSKTNSI